MKKESLNYRNDLLLNPRKEGWLIDSTSGQNRWFVYKNGSVYDLKKQRFLKSHNLYKNKPWRRPYMTVSIKDRKGVIRTISLAKLVASIYLPHRDETNEIIFFNGDSTDCHVENLCWVTREAQLEYNSSRKLYERNKLTPEEVIEIYKDKITSYEVLGDRYGVATLTIYDIKHERTWAWLE